MNTIAEDTADSGEADLRSNEPQLTSNEAFVTQVTKISEAMNLNSQVTKLISGHGASPPDRLTNWMQELMLVEPQRMTYKATLAHKV